ncbi:MAG TPA: hypothetical protein VGC80_08765, partial [Acetobacteraceae bacterium]
MSAPTSCGLTVLRARGRRLCKVIRPDGEMVDYDQVKLVDIEPLDVVDLLALHGLLHRLGRRRDCCVVRGALADPSRMRD